MVLLAPEKNSIKLMLDSKAIFWYNYFNTNLSALLPSASAVLLKTY